MSATIHSRLGVVLAAFAVAAGMLAALAGCAELTPREHAVEAARAYFHKVQEGIEAELPELPNEQFREYILSSERLGLSASLIDVDAAGIRAASYGFQNQGSFVLDAWQDGSTGTALLIVSSYYETGGGLSYKRESVFACLTVSIDLAAKRILGYGGASCTDDVYAAVTRDKEIDFSEIEG